MSFHGFGNLTGATPKRPPLSKRTTRTIRGGWYEGIEIDEDCGATCPRCKEALVSPDWSEFVNEGLVLNLWSCTKCGDRFETEVVMPANAAPGEIDWEQMLFPPLLVA